jgi:hypothetical protein
MLVGSGWEVRHDEAALYRAGSCIAAIHVVVNLYHTKTIKECRSLQHVLVPSLSLAEDTP